MDQLKLMGPVILSGILRSLDGPNAETGECNFSIFFVLFSLA